MKTVRVMLVVLAAVVAILFLRPGPAPVTTLTGSTMGTTYTVHLAEALDTAAQTRWRACVEQCVDGVNARMSTYLADSEVSRFNRSTSTDWFPVSADVSRVVAAALEVAEQTEGAFDVTVGPLVNLWSFGPDQRPAGIPTDVEIEAARAVVGYQQLEVRRDPPALRKRVPGVTIDLSAIAKGFAVDQVAVLLDDGGCAGYMVEIGGEVRTRGARGDGKPWRIGIEQPSAGRRAIQGVLEMNNGSLATSGDYRNFFSWDGELYSHQIDPDTGRPARHGTASVSVQHPSSAMWADAYATGLMVMRPDRAWDLAQRLGLEIMMVSRTRQGYQQRTTPGFSIQSLRD